MLRIQPFLALRPVGSRAVLVSCPAHCEASGCCESPPSPDSFLHVVKGGDPDQASDALHRLVELGALCEEAEPRMYVYRIARSGHRQVGIVACAERGDLRGTAAVGPAWAEPGEVVFDDPENHIASIAADDMNERPVFHFNAGDGSTHTGWVVQHPARYVRAFASLPGSGEWRGQAAAAGDDSVLAVLLERSTVLDPPAQPRCGLFVQRIAMASPAS